MASEPHATLSYDPRTWVALDPPVPAADWRRASFGGAVAALLMFGGAVAWLQRAAPVAIDATAAPLATRVDDGGARRTRRSFVLSGVRELPTALVEAGVPRADAHAAARVAAPALDAAGEISAALTLEETDGSYRLARLEVSNADSSGAVVTPNVAGGFALSRVAPRLESRIVVRRGRMDADSFYSSAVAAGISDSLIPEFARALAFDFDFQREVNLGDVFEAAFEQRVNAAGRPVGLPRLLYAELNTAAKSGAVYRFAPPGGQAEWFDASGRSIVRALMRTPVDGARVSSKFGNRTHPILGFQKLHGGVDFAAPIGTPIYAAGNAVVVFAGPKGPNGNFVKLLHDNRWETLYLHMNRFAPGIAAGVRVAQGQQIGEIGTTGRSTGPHLHYEVHIDGQRVDPLTIQTESGRTLTGAALIAFAKERDRIDVSRAGQAG